MSLVSTTFVKRLKKSSSITPTTTVLSSFTNDRIPTHGSIVLPILIAGLATQHKFIVTDQMDTEFLIGIDFLKDHKITLNLGDGTLQTHQGSCKFFNKPHSTPKTMKIRAEKTTIIPPNTMQYMRGKIPQTGNNFQGLTEPYMNTMSNTGLLIANAMVYTKKRSLPVQCINATDESITIHKGKLLGFLQPLDSGDSVYNVTASEDHSLTQSQPSHPQENVQSTPKEKWTREELFHRLKLQDLQSKLPSTEMSSLKNLLWEHRSAFSYDDADLGCCNMYEAKLELKPNHQPKWIPSRPVPYKLEGEMEKHIETMLKSGVIEPLTTPSNFNSPIFLVSKKSPKPESGDTPTPGSFRVVVDLRSVNEQTMDDCYELPNINHVLDRIGGNKFFSTFDFSSSFHQIPYAKECRPITAFTYKNNRYHFARMIMGHKTSSSKFSFMIHKLIGNLPISSLIYYIDDLLLGTKSVQQHLIDLKFLLSQLQSANLKLKPSKTELLKSEVKYVGININAEGIRITDDRIKAIQDLKPPTNVKTLQKVLGFFNYNRKFIPKYANIAHPLYALLRKDRKFVWDSQCSDSLQTLKDAMTNSTTLRYPDVLDPNNSYHVVLDASKWGFGATLSQEQEGHRYTVAYFSQSLPNHKREWGQTKLEFECLYAALRHWKLFLYNTHFRIVTDCKSLLNWQTIFSKNNPTMIRKLQELSTFRFDIQHISGKENVVADFLSRYPHRKYSVNKETQTDSISVNSLSDDPVLLPSNTPAPVIDIFPPLNGTTQTAYDAITPTHPTPNPALDEDNDSPLSILFSEAQESYGNVQVVSTIKTTVDIPCICSIPEMCKPTEQVNLVHCKDPLPSESEVLSSIQLQNVTFPDTETISLEQKNDPILKEVITWVQSGDRPKIQVNRTPAALVVLWKQFNLLSYERGLLLRKWINTKDPDTPRSLIVVPESLTEAIMETFHKSIMSCHPGVERTLHQCRHFFYWPKMQLDFNEYITACTTCQETKQTHHFLRAPLKQLIFHHFNDCIVVDHIVPEQEGRTPRGFRYILTITDSFSNYLVAVPVKTQTSKDNVKAIFRNWVLTFGMPKELIVDNHPGFTSEFFSQVFKAFDCKKTHGTSYKSRSTGRAENSNKRLNQAMRTILPKGKETQWDLYLSYATFALNCLNNRKTGFSANRMVFGTELNTPLSVLVEDSNSYKPSIVDLRSQEAYNLRKTMKSIIRKVRENSDTEFRYAKNYHDKNLMGPFFKVFDLCFLLINCPTHKFGARWKGPFQITQVVNDHLYKVLIAPGNEKIINISKMKHYQSNKFSANPLVRHTVAPNVTVSNDIQTRSVPPQEEDPEFITVSNDSQTRSVPPQEEDPEFITVSNDSQTRSVPPQEEDPEFITVEIPRNPRPRTLFKEILPSTSPEKSNNSTQGTTSSFCSPDPIPDKSPTSNSNTSLATPPSLQDVPLDVANVQQPQRRQLRSRSIIKSPVRYLGYVLRLNRGARARTFS